MTEKETMDAHPIGDAMKTTNEKMPLTAESAIRLLGSMGYECPALTSKEAGDGWVLVPVEPTRAMLDAGHHDLTQEHGIDPMLKYAWSQMIDAAPQPQNHSEDVREVADCKGYALLGSGQYIINHSQDFDPELGAELMITLASEEDKASRTVGDLKDNPTPGSLIYPKDMVIRIGFINERGLFALEQQLQIIREQFFPDPAANPLGDVEQPEAVEPVAWLVEAWNDNYASRSYGYFDAKENAEAAVKSSRASNNKVIPLYKASPTASQVLKMAADIVEDQSEEMYCQLAARKIRALIPPAESDQRKLGFAEGVKVAAEVIEQWAYTAEHYGYDGDAKQFRDGKEEILALTPPTDTEKRLKQWFTEGGKARTDTVTMTREELEEFGMRVATNATGYGAMWATGVRELSVDKEELRAIVAQHMPKEEK